MSKTWIKICGTTSLEDALASVEAGADALGFIFAESPRRVTPEQARDIIKRLPREVEKIGVFVEQSFQEIDEIVKVARLTGAQLHGEPLHTRDILLEYDKKRKKPRSWLQRVFGRPHPLPTLISVMRLPRQPDPEKITLKCELKAMHGRLPDELSPRCDHMMYDRRVDGGPAGGTGEALDWEAWSKAGFIIPGCILAGGLTPDNVGQAIAALRPYGVDVVSGVEREKGKKDHAKLRAFVEAVREADAKKDPAR
jgi:phosphoribosylanthranilate isomerase